MKKKLSLLLALALCLALLPCAYASSSPFSDVPSDHWAYDAVMETYNDGVMTGTAPGVFDPSGKLSMAQFVTVLTRAFYNEDVLNSPLSGDWPSQNYDAAEKHNLFTGLTRWGNDIEVTREVMAQMMYNVMVDKSVVLPNAEELADTIANIPDSSSVDAAFQTAAAACYYWDLLSGTDAGGSFSPKGLLNRAQTAVIYTRLKKAVNGLSAGTSEDPGDARGSQASPAATLTNGMPVTEENVLALIEEYRNGKEPGEKAKAAGFTSYTSGSTYDAYNPGYSLSPYGNGKECAKFAFAFWDDIFGSDAPIQEVTNPANARPGDLIQAPSHWSIVASNVTDYEGIPSVLTVGGGSAGIIGWDSSGGQLLSSEYVTVYTRYPLS